MHRIMLAALGVALFATTAAAEQRRPAQPGIQFPQIIPSGRTEATDNVQASTPDAQAEKIGNDLRDKLIKLRKDAFADFKYAKALAKATGNTVTLPCWTAWVELLSRQQQELKDDDGNVLTEPDPAVFTTIERGSELVQQFQIGSPIFVGCSAMATATGKSIQNLAGSILTGGPAAIGALKPIGLPILP